MRVTNLILVIALIFILISVFFIFSHQNLNVENNNLEHDIIKSMEDTKELILTSPAFEHNGQIPSKYTCDGEDLNPPLSISGVDPNAKSLVLIMEDPDVPKHLREDGMWNHWIKFNIPIDINTVEEGIEPQGRGGKGTSGNIEYHGPCPPDGEHRYLFMLYTLDAELDLKEGVSKEVVKSAMTGHILQKTELIGLYSRK